MAVQSIYTMIDAESVNHEHEAYATFLQNRLMSRYPEATILVETTTTESGVMPQTIEAETWQEREEVAFYLSTVWDEYCSQ